jgi:hypothetical protein
MAFSSLRRGGFSIHAVNSEESFSPRWLRLLDAADGIGAVRLGAAAAAAPAILPETQAAIDHGTGPIHVDPPAPALVELDFSGLGPNSDGLWRFISFAPLSSPDSPDSPAEAALAPGDFAPAGVIPNDGAPIPAAQVDEASILTGPPGPDSVWQPSTLAPDPLPDAPAAPESAPTPDDPDPAAGHLPKSEAVIWSGPAIMAFPTDAHETGGDLAPPEATIDGALTRADLDPVLASMASGHSILSGLGDGDLGAAFLPPESSDLADLPLGLDVGGLFTPPPLPPPEMIWG